MGGPEFRAQTSNLTYSAIGRAFGKRHSLFISAGTVGGFVLRHGVASRLALTLSEREEISTSPGP